MKTKVPSLFYVMEISGQVLESLTLKMLSDWFRASFGSFHLIFAVGLAKFGNSCNFRRFVDGLLSTRLHFSSIFVVILVIFVIFAVSLMAFHLLICISALIFIAGLAKFCNSCNFRNFRCFVDGLPSTHSYFSVDFR